MMHHETGLQVVVNYKLPRSRWIGGGKGQRSGAEGLRMCVGPCTTMLAAVVAQTLLTNGKIT